jgi:hypothetical protein
MDFAPFIELFYPIFYGIKRGVVIVNDKQGQMLLIAIISILSAISAFIHRD